MGKLLSGPMGTNVGKLGGFVSYFLNGELVTRSIGKVDRWSDAQLAVQMRTALTNALLKPVKPVVRLGMKFSPKPKKSWSAYTLALSLNNPAAIKGDYPDLEINFEKVVLSSGEIPVPLNAKVEFNEGRLIFSWDADLESEEADEDDRVVCVAYFPESFQSFNVTDRAKRRDERQEIKLPSFTEEMKIETYIFYYSEERKQSSNSIYLGQFLWTNK